jgi:HD-like signal output (HDOD) protein
VTDLERLIAETVSAENLPVPPYPSIGMRLRQLVATDTYSVSDLSRIVAEDQALAAAVLRVANSPTYRGIKAITALPEAIGRIGADETSRVALALSLGAVRSAHGPLAELRRVTWRQSMGSALCCEHLARYRGLDSKEAFVCGLLHDFGRVVTISAIEEIIRKHRELQNVAMSEAAWAELVDRFHVEVGLLTAARWKLPPMLHAVISSHHDRDLAGNYLGMVEVVIASDEIVALLERCPCVLDRDVRELRELNGPGEIAALMRVLPLVPPFLMGLDELMPIAAPTAAQDSLVAKAEGVLAHAKPIQLDAVWVRAGSETPVRIEAAADDGVVVRTTKTPLIEGNLVWLRLPLPGGEPLQLSARVVRTVREKTTHRSEVRFFALDAAKQARWAAYATTLEPRAA